MDLQLKDKVIIVTGGAKGIGEGIVKVLANEGAFPVIIGRSQEDNLATVEAIKAEGGKLRRLLPNFRWRSYASSQ
jgi:NAD(P)-dependent dehydrogenase (short-subunit alcohol dehydrogenase family)